MSLINQVLQDLDRRHAGTTLPPAAALRVAPASEHERPRLVAGAVGAGLVAVAIGVAAALLWRQVDAHAASLASTAPPVAAAIVSAPTAQPRAGAVAFAATADAAPSPFTLTLPGAGASVGELVDLAAPASSPAPAEAMASITPASAPASPPARVAIAAPDAPLAAAATPVQLEKSSPPLSPAERADVEYRRGIELHEHARTGDAESAFAAALQHDGRHASARRALAVEWIGAGRAQDAERLLAEGLALNPQQPRLAVVLARVQAERHDLAAGIETLRASLGGSRASATDQAEALALMATLQQSAGQHREAVEGFAAALRQSPHNGAWWIGLGISLAADGRSASAREAFERARTSGTLTPELLQYIEQRLRATP